MIRFYFNKWLYALSFVLLFTQPIFFTVIAIPISLVALRKGWRFTISPFIFSGLLGVLSQVVGPQFPYNLMLPPKNITDTQVKSNIIAPYNYSDLSSWDSNTQKSTRSAHLADGYRRVKRYSQENIQFNEIVTFRNYQVKPNQTYTLSFYFRSDGSKPSFNINFITPRGFRAVPATILALNNNLKRAYATIKTSDRDTSIRGLNLLNFAGKWTYLDIAYIQLELGSQPSTYNVANNEIMSGLWSRIFWWLGLTILAFCILLASSWLLTQVTSEQILITLLFGLTVQVAVSITQVTQTSERATGFLGIDNYLGHFAVACSALAWLLGRGSKAVFFALVLSFALVWLSGSRAALLGLALVMLGYLWDNRNRWLLILAIGLLTATCGWIWGRGNLGRLATVADFNYFTTQARIQIWEVAHQAFTKYPLSGIGFNRFNIYYLDNLPLNAAESSAGHTHSLFWQLLSEGGLIGFCGFSFLWGWFIFRLIYNKQYAFLGFFLVFLVLNIFDLTWYTAGLHSVLWLGLAFTLKRTPDIKTPISIA
jgi:O-antigen ligase